MAIEISFEQYLVDITGCTKTLRQVSFANSGLGDTRFQILVRCKNIYSKLNLILDKHILMIQLIQQPCIARHCSFLIFQVYSCERNAGKKSSRMSPSTNSELIKMRTNGSKCAICCQHH